MKLTKDILLNYFLRNTFHDKWHGAIRMSIFNQNVILYYENGTNKVFNWIKDEFES